VNQPFDAPAYAIDPGAQGGAVFLWRGERKEHVLAAFRARLNGKSDMQAGTLVVDQVDLREGAQRQGVRRVYDRGGCILNERLVTWSESRGPREDPAMLFAPMDQGSVAQRLHYRYEPGWLLEQESAGAGRTLRFVSKRPEPGLPSFPVNEHGQREFVTAMDAIKPRTSSAAGADLKNYFFREFRMPRQLELNPGLPGCTNVWSVWTAVDLGPDGTKLAQSELVYDARHNLSVCKTAPTGASGKTQSAVAYQLPEPDEHTWQELRLSGPTNSIPLALGGSTNLSGCDFVYVYLWMTNRVSWAVRFKSTAAQPVRAVPRAFGARNADVLAWAPTNLVSRLWSADFVAYGEPSVDAPCNQTARDSLVVISVPELARAGLDVTRITSMVLDVSGRTGDSVHVSPVSQLRPP